MKPTKYDFLLALDVGERYTFDNKPTLSEAHRKVCASSRTAYQRVSSGITVLHKRHADVGFRIKLETSPGSRINGDKVVVIMLRHGERRVQGEEFEESEERRRLRQEAWKKRKQAEDAPKLPGQLAEAEAKELARRTAGALRRAQAIHADRPIIDPVKLAELAVAHAQGKPIQRLNGSGWVDDPAPTWKEATAKYRIKPAIREFWIVVGRDGKPSAIADSIEHLPHHDPACRVLAREVINEEAP